MNLDKSDCLESMEDAINALKMLTTLCSVSQQIEHRNMFWLLQPIVKKQEEMLADLWKIEAKK